MGYITERRPGVQGSARQNRGGSSGKYRGRRVSWRIALCIILPWVLVCVNAVTVVRLRGQIKELNMALGRLQSKLSAIEGDKELIGDVADAAAAVSHAVTEDTAILDYVDLWGLDKVDKPKERTLSEILRRLEQLGKDSGLIAEVADAYRSYPEQLLEALANNPEMADFAAHYLDNKGTITGEGLTESERGQEYPLFLQWDPRWGYASYGDDSVVGLSGCGPTALSMVLYYLTGNEELTPDKIAEYSMEEGYYISGTGTAWLLLEDVPPVFGVSVSQPQKNELVMRQALDKGKLIICSMGPGDFTVGGHFVVVYGCTEEGFLLNDPNCVARSRQVWPYSQIGGQIKHIWVFDK